MIKYLLVAAWLLLGAMVVLAQPAQPPLEKILKARIATAQQRHAEARVRTEAVVDIWVTWKTGMHTRQVTACRGALVDEGRRVITYHACLEPVSNRLSVSDSVWSTELVFKNGRRVSGGGASWLNKFVTFSVDPSVTQGLAAAKLTYAKSTGNVDRLLMEPSATPPASLGFLGREGWRAEIKTSPWFILPKARTSCLYGEPVFVGVYLAGLNSAIGREGESSFLGLSSEFQPVFIVLNEYNYGSGLCGREPVRFTALLRQ